jgi:hypothetical protein
MRRPFTIALLVFEALFFNVFIPVHTRGMIQLAGVRNGASCCATRHKDSKENPSDNKPASTCAICAFAARLSVPPAVDFAPPPTGLVEILPPPAPHVRVNPSFVPVYFGRAPPIV